MVKSRCVIAAKGNTEVTRDVGIIAKILYWEEKRSSRLNNVSCPKVEESACDLY